MKQLRMESTPSNGKTFQEWDPSFIRALKDRVDEDTDYNNRWITTSIIILQSMI